MQRGRSTGDPAIYVTANALMTGAVTLDGALQIAKEAGADGFELRRELLPLPLPPALGAHIRLQLQQFSSPPAYSLPRSIFTDGSFEREPLLQALGEARSLGCRLVKFSSIGVGPVQASQHPGGLAGIPAGLRELRALLESEANELVVTVENDQSAVSGDLQLWESFFEQARAVECPVGMTFDLGNCCHPIVAHLGVAQGQDRKPRQPEQCLEPFIRNQRLIQLKMFEIRQFLQEGQAVVRNRVAIQCQLPERI